MPPNPPREPTLSIRLLWPFVRLMGMDARGASNGAEDDPISPELVDPETRLRHSTVIRLLKESIRTKDDPAIGLRAAAIAEPGDIDVLEYAARGCENLGEAYKCTARYFGLLNEAAELTLRTEGQQAILRYLVTSHLQEPPAAADFVIAGMVHFTRRNAQVDETGVELRFTHPEPSYADRYKEFFTGPIRFGAAENAIVMPLARLAAPMLAPGAGLSRAFQRRAEQLLERLQQRQTTEGRVRALIAAHLGSGQVTMDWAARKLGMSVPTLRRHLDAEDVTFSEIIDEVRKQVAERELTEGSAAVGEVAFVLGFSNIGAFDRAFKRWTGVVPSEYRARARNR